MMTISQLAGRVGLSRSTLLYYERVGLLEMLDPQCHPEPPLDKAGWVSLLRSSGMGDDDMWRWHREFERQMPEAHGEFLASLGMNAEEIRRVRNRSLSVPQP